ncbi:cytochrome c [Dyella solisilvae]|uniref:Cytochrome c n=1 Tax=Dyella solisilvae TaxID=1920168 RepID=A0A370KBM4_9GAMM|nr:cytochrome c [Dyella solisilvae]RDI99847.1 cytochrome c [Dyella solisilvae]
MSSLLRRLCLLILCLAPPLQAADLSIDLGHGTRTYSTAQLLARQDVRTISIPVDVAYKRSMRYRAVPLKALLSGAAPDDALLFVANDGFAAEIPARLLLKAHGAEAWLAIEEPEHPWPALADDKPGAGPFYLVWTDPQAMRIGPEQWPFQLASIRRLAPVAERFPALNPDPSVRPDSAVARGFAVFQRTCLACHTLNGQGDARLGPDLNIPHSATEYLREDLLRAYIRDPQSLRRWPQARMPGFDRDALSNADLDALLAYLRHMAAHKVQH